MTSTNLVLNVRGLVAATVVTFMAVMVFAAPASAHNYYVSSTPAINQVLTSLPEEFIVTTNDNLLELGGMEGGFFMEVKGPDGLYYGDGCVTVSGPSVTMPAAVGPDGNYSLSWQVISADGHTVSDEIPFSWQPAAGKESTAAGASTPPNCGKETGSPVSDTPTSGQAAVSESSSDILWIGGAVVAVAIAVIATLMLIRPRKKD